MKEDKIEIIDNTDKAKDKYGHFYGSAYIELSAEQLQALLNGKCLAFNNEEYSTFFALSKEVKL